ncbi:MAG TPA: AAA family ATPase [Polyangia bacterium]|jgi:predicted ATPase|nr:AAA family ATPase [Polyangia bacterium]
MHIEALEVAGYRSLRRLRLPLGPVSVITGPNGSGKTNLYRALYLLHAAAQGTLARTLASEGGMPSALWAGGREKGPVRMSVGVELGDLSYSLALGLPNPPAGSFLLDPVVKEEQVLFREGRRKIELMSRKARSVWLRDAEGERQVYPADLWEAESVLCQLVEPHRYPVLSTLRQQILAWRFYHHFRTDEEAPIRRAQVGVRTPVLSHDGRDLAAALETILDIGDPRGLHAAVERAFPGARLNVEANNGRFLVGMHMPGIGRRLEAAELSDGTLRYLCLLAALMSPRPPPFLALNEPETSLHPDLLVPLAHAVAEAARNTQIWLTTHSEPLVAALEKLCRTTALRLARPSGETQLGRWGERDAAGEEGEAEEPEEEG